MNKIFLMLLSASYFLTFSVLAMDLPSNKFQSITGKIVEKPWQKSQQSYCQGGANYYVLQTQDAEIVLNSQRDTEMDDTTYLKMQAKLANLVEKTITITGQWVKKSFAYEEHCPPMAQCIAQDITCHWFKIQQINGPN